MIMTILIKRLIKFVFLLDITLFSLISCSSTDKKASPDYSQRPVKETKTEVVTKENPSVSVQEDYEPFYTDAIFESNSFFESDSDKHEEDVSVSQFFADEEVHTAPVVVNPVKYNYCPYGCKICRLLEENEAIVIPIGDSAVVENFAGIKESQTLSSYTIGRFEVTQALYKQLMGYNPSHFISDAVSGEVQEKRPVEKVSWYDALFFCNELTKHLMSEDDCCYEFSNIERNSSGSIVDAVVSWDSSKKGYRLPTQTEWEFAARGGKNGGWNFRFSGSNDSLDVAWGTFDSGDKTHQVGKKMANGCGTYDMSGNVWEWCWDKYPDDSTFRFIRGGSFYNNFSKDYDMTVDYRYGNKPSSRYSNVGFRVARSL